MVNQKLSIKKKHCFKKAGIKHKTVFFEIIYIFLFRLNLNNVYLYRGLEIALNIIFWLVFVD